jgi:hypothetical protein
VDWGNHTLTIKRSVATMGRGNLITKDTKTHQARTLALDEFGEETLKLHLRVTEDRAADLGISVTPDSPIFTYDMVRPITPSGTSPPPNWSGPAMTSGRWPVASATGTPR